nr:hypothetical protein [uncultured Lachnoclostridium sp.]
MLLFNQTLQIGDVLEKLMDKKKQIRMPKEYYPELFEEANSTEQKAEDKSCREMKLHKARMDDFVFMHNRAFRERGESSGRNDAGETASNNRGTDKSLL